MIVSEFSSIAGIKIIPSLAMVEKVEDWSDCRSPSRAMRRHRLGHRQRMVVREVPRKDALMIDGEMSVYMHPYAIKQLEIAVEGDAPYLSGYLR